jgi:hypothetical protein
LISLLLFFFSNELSHIQHVLSGTPFTLNSKYLAVSVLFSRYSFAIVGINLTHMAYSLLRDRSLRSHVYNAAEGVPPVHIFHRFYRSVPGFTGPFQVSQVRFRVSQVRSRFHRSVPGFTGPFQVSQVPFQVSQGHS